MDHLHEAKNVIFLLLGADLILFVIKIIGELFNFIPFFLEFSGIFIRKLGVY